MPPEEDAGTPEELLELEVTSPPWGAQPGSGNSVASRAPAKTVASLFNTEVAQEEP